MRGLSMSVVDSFCDVRAVKVNMICTVVPLY